MIIKIEANFNSFEFAYTGIEDLLISILLCKEPFLSDTHNYNTNMT